MSELTLNDVETIVDTMAQVALDNEKYFSELDGLCGDGDFGTSLAGGFKAMREQWQDLDRTTLTAFLMKCGMIITSKVGGCSGPLWGTAFMRAGSILKGKDGISFDDVAALSQAAQEGMMARGGAQLGDKTLLDAMHPATEALVSAGNQGASWSQAFGAAARASGEATETAKSWVAKRGRQSFTGDRSKDTLDPGMVAVTTILEAVASRFSS